MPAMASAQLLSRARSAPAKTHLAYGRGTAVNPGFRQRRAGAAPPRGMQSFNSTTDNAATDEWPRSLSMG